MLGVLTFVRRRRPLSIEVYSRAASLFVWTSHRRRSVLVRMTESGEHLETVRIVNTDDRVERLNYVGR